MQFQLLCTLLFLKSMKSLGSESESARHSPLVRAVPSGLRFAASPSLDDLFQFFHFLEDLLQRIRIRLLYMWWWWPRGCLWWSGGPAGGGGEPAPGGGPTGDDAWADVEDPLVPPPRWFHSHLAVQEQHQPVNVDKIATTTSSQS